MSLPYTSTFSLGASADFPQRIKTNQNADTLDRNPQSQQLRKHTETVCGCHISWKEREKILERTTNSTYVLCLDPGDRHLRHVGGGFSATPASTETEDRTWSFGAVLCFSCICPESIPTNHQRISLYECLPTNKNGAEINIQG